MIIFISSPRVSKPPIQCCWVLNNWAGEGHLSGKVNILRFQFGHLRGMRAFVWLQKKQRTHCIYFQKSQKEKSLHQVPSEMTPLPGWEKLNSEWHALEAAPPPGQLEVCFFMMLLVSLGGVPGKETRSLILPWAPVSRKSPSRSTHLSTLSDALPIVPQP